MSRNLSYPDFIKLVAFRCNKSEKSVKKMYETMIDLIAEELRLNGEIHLRNFADLRATYVPAQDRWIPTRKGTQELKFCEPKVRVKIVPADFFKRRINDYIIGDANERKEALEQDKDAKRLKSKAILTQKYGTLLEDTGLEWGIESDTEDNDND
jgi:nucleoid DNA-binding protein